MASPAPTATLPPANVHGGIAGHFLHGVAPSAVTSTSVGVAAALALARATALLLLSVPCLSSLARLLALLLLLSPSLVLLLCSDLATLQSAELTFGSVGFQGGLTGVKEEPATARRGLTGEVPHYLS